ncbi:Fic family protein [Chitinophaga niastensis]|uniref:Fic family protein n=1 Tax=Chitinophaga niastensis TaxID=536980 RepID=A0A2P8HMX5_CHINA|nr:Fic family protein [Chitinophaga niastensis]PSL47540.1 Fic family protein [Chitinophaga niastensis]
MQPPYNITNSILELVASISEKTGKINASDLYKPTAALRKTNRIKTIHSSLEIEGNTLSFEQVTDIINNKRVLAPQKDILEVKNAIALYARLSEFKPNNLTSLLKAHKILMDGLVNSPGNIRTKAVGVVKGSKVAHLAPPGQMVKPLMNNLFAYLKTSKDLALIKSCVFHYELEFIHPFTDGNGRMGRFWQTVILMSQYPVFEFLPVETIIKKKQKEYYNALGISDKSGHSTVFIEFMLQVISEGLDELLLSQLTPLSGKDRIELFRRFVNKNAFTRKDYLTSFNDISSATASRDLKEAVDNYILKKDGDKRATSYKFI